MEVRINNILVDSGDSVIAITKQGFDFSDLKKRFLGRSNRISIPKTTKNSEILQAPDLINTGAGSFETLYNVSIEDQGIVLIKGVGILQESAKDYKLQVIDGGKTLFDSMTDKLNALDLRDEDFIFNLTTHAATRVYSGNDTILIWGDDVQVIDDDYTKTPWTGNIKYSRPHFRGDILINKILESKGWMLNLDPLIELERSAVSCNHDNFYATNYEGSLDYTFIGNIPFVFLEVFPQFVHPDVDASGFQYIGIPNIPTSLRIIGDVSATTDYILIIEVIADGETIIDEFTISSLDTTINIQTQKYSADAGVVTIIPRLEGAGEITFSNTFIYTITEENDFGDMSGGTPYVGLMDGYLIKIYENLPNMSQLDLMRELWTVFPFNFTINQTTKELNTYSIGELSRTNAVDWSNKFVTGSEKISLSKANIGKSTLLLYSNDDTIPETEGAALFTVDNDTLNNREEYLKSSFSASSINSSVYNEPVAKMAIYSATERVNSLTVRVKKTFDISGEPTAMGFNPINFSNLRTGKYKTIVDALQKGRAIKAQFDLNKLDVVGVDFSKTIYIDDFKSYFILANIGNYVPGKLTTCELLKIN